MLFLYITELVRNHSGGIEAGYRLVYQHGADTQEKHYRSKKNPSQATPFFAFVMPFRKFAMMKRCLHGGALDTPARGQPGFDPWNKVRPIFDAINITFKKHYLALQYSSLDESMVGTKNHVVFLQYMPNKRHSQFGIKKFELCDSATEYAMLVELYAGKDFAIRSDMGQAHGVVMDLVRKANVLDKGYHLFVYKASLGTDTFGNFKKGLPSPPTKMDVGTMLSYRHQQRKPVLMFSTATAAGMVEERTCVGVVKQKPKCVSSYNKYARGMDISDRKIYHV